MALILADRVKESTTTTGTSDFALGGAVTGFQSFATAVGANNTTYYAISDGADWEVGLGTLSSDGLTLVRTTVYQSSNSDTKVSFASGTKQIFVTYAADKAVFEDASGNVTLPANLTVTGGSTTDSVQLDLSAGVTPTVGQIAWDAAQGTATLGLLGGNVLSRLGESLVAYVTNAESTTITKGQAVYLFGAQGDRATVKLANNTGDATSAKTLGIVAEDITANGTGFVVCQGVVYGLNLSAFTAGDTIYLGSTAGTLTATKPYAPNHLVYLGVVEKANAGAGQLYVRVQNGYELDELHNVSAQSPTTGQTIVYNESTSLWEKNTVSLTAGVNGTLPPANGGTGITSLGSGVATFLGTPSSANLAAAVTDETGTGALVFANSPTLVTPALGTPSSATLTNATGLPISTGVSGLGTGIATALAVNVGSAGAPVVNGGALGTPSSGTVTNLTGTASININGTVGATTPTTGAFTTLSASGNVTISGGTANGVTYLNGSKVLTSGSALTFDGTNLAVGTTSPLNSLVVTKTSRAGFEVAPEDATNVSLYSYNRNTSAWTNLLYYASNQIFCANGTTEGMRLTSIGLGIGTSSPNANGKLTVAGNIVFPSAGNSIVDDAGNNIIQRTAGGYVTIGATAWNQIRFGTAGGAQAMTLDSSGNLGLGVTPSAWSFKAIQNGNAALWTANTNAYLSTNLYYGSGGRTYIANGFSSELGLSSGGFQFQVSGSGTAGGAVTQTQAMTLDASGNLGVGTTSPAYKLQIVEAKTLTPTTGDGQIAIDNSTSGQVSAILLSSQGTRRAQISAGLGGTGNDGYLAFTTRNDTTGFGERARIDSSGNLLVGTTTNTPAQSNVSGFKVGSGQIECNGTNTQAAFFGRSNDGQVVRFYNAGSAAGNISNTGTTTSYNGTSDYRLKDNIQPMVGALEKVAQLKPCTYIWKADGRLGQGFIAHELQEVIPDAVQGTKDEVDENGIPEYQGIDPRMVVATLTAAIQEQQAIIETLKARLDAANL